MGAAQCLYAFGAALCVIDTWWSIGFIVAVQTEALGLQMPGQRRKSSEE
jgi:hypothetical protein